MLPGTEVEFVQDRNGIHPRPAKARRGITKREREVADALDRLRGSATIKMSTEQITALTRGRLEGRGRNAG